MDRYESDEAEVSLVWIYGSMAIVALVVLLLNLIPAVAWWTLTAGKASGRGWAIATGIVDLLICLGGLAAWARSGSAPLLWTNLGIGLVAIATLTAFWRKDSAAAATDGKPPKVVRLPGDGTSKIKDYTAQIVSVAILWISFHLWNHWSGARHLSEPSFTPALLLLQIAIVVNTSAHEMGHFIAGWASGMLLRRFQVGPAMWAVRNGEWRFELQWNRFYGGAVGMVSPTLENIRGREAFMIAGGPVASLVVGAVATVLTLSAPGHFWEPYWALLSMVAAMGWSSFVTNLIPLKSAANYSDGAQLYQLISGGEWGQFHLAFGMVASSLVTQIRPRDFDVALLNRAAGFITQGERALLLRLFACKHYIDADMVPEGLSSMADAEVLYEQSVFDKPEDICTEFIFLNAFYKRDLASAELWSRRIDALSKVDMDADYWRAQTALLWLKGDLEKAREAWERGNELAQKLPKTGAYVSTLEAFQELRQVLDTPVARTPPPLPYHADVFLPNHQTTPIVAVV
jgi:hypothetical protein